MTIRYYRRDGTLYPPGKEGLMQWGKDLGNPDYRQVMLTQLDNGVEVSTVWLGLDHRVGEGRPLIFETMLFTPHARKFVLPSGWVWTQSRESIGETWRYSTEEEAVRGHKMQVKKWSQFKTADQVLSETARKDGLQ